MYHTLQLNFGGIFYGICTAYSRFEENRNYQKTATATEFA